MKGGTLGCFVTTTDGKMAALSNEHVLRHGMHSDRRVYQPRYDDCLGFECNKIGESIAGLVTAHLQVVQTVRSCGGHRLVVGLDGTAPEITGAAFPMTVLSLP